MRLSLRTNTETHKSICVIMLHGLGRTARSMAKMAQAFHKLGYGVVNQSYPSRKYPIEKLSQLAIDAALSHCDLKTTTHIHFVTHSLGGILVRVYLEKAALPKLGRVVMLAPPNQGSHIVDKLGDLPGFAVINGRAATQLGTGPDSVPSKLGPVTYPVGVIAGRRSVNWLLSRFLPGANDGRVTTENTKVAGMTGYIEVAASHPFIMRSNEAIQQAVAFIQTGAFSQF